MPITMAPRKTKTRLIAINSSSRNMVPPSSMRDNDLASNFIHPKARICFAGASDLYFALHKTRENHCFERNAVLTIRQHSVVGSPRQLPAGIVEEFPAIGGAEIRNDFAHAFDAFMRFERRILAAHIRLYPARMNE